MRWPSPLYDCHRVRSFAQDANLAEIPLYVIGFICQCISSEPLWKSTKNSKLASGLFKCNGGRSLAAFQPLMGTHQRPRATELARGICKPWVADSPIAGQSQAGIFALQGRFPRLTRFDAHSGVRAVQGAARHRREHEDGDGDDLHRERLYKRSSGFNDYSFRQERASLSDAALAHLGFRLDRERNFVAYVSVSPLGRTDIPRAARVRAYFRSKDFDQ
jgi:hypothetical protein